VLCWGGKLGSAGCLELSLIFMDSGLSALVPLYLFETKQPPDEGYIRHALSYFPTIIPWSWTTTISVPCLPLGYIDPAYVSQYCQRPRGPPISNLCPPHPICIVRVTFLYLLDILRLQSLRHHSTFQRHHQTNGTFLLNVLVRCVCGFLPSMIPCTFGFGFGFGSCT
jgi:hypothetical protein